MREDDLLPYQPEQPLWYQATPSAGRRPLFPFRRSVAGPPGRSVEVIGPGRHLGHEAAEFEVVPQRLRRVQVSGDLLLGVAGVDG